MIILKLKSSCLKQEIFVRRHLLSLLCKIIFNFLFMAPSKNGGMSGRGGFLRLNLIVFKNIMKKFKRITHNL